MGLFGKTDKKPPKDQVNEWCHKLRKETSQLDRQIRGIQREEEKIKKSLKEAAKKGDQDVCAILAKQVMKARKSINKIHTTKTQINSVQLQMKTQLATLRVTGSLQKSTEVMAMMQNLVRLTDVAESMREMSKEMMKAGIIEEMLEDTFEGMEEDPDELEEEAQKEVDKILWELTAGTLGKAPAAVTDTLPSTSKAPVEDSEEEEDLEEMQSRLEALKAS